MAARKRIRRNERAHGQGSVKDYPNGDARAWKPPQPDGSRPSRLFHPPSARAKAEAWLRGIAPSPSMPLGQWCELWFARRAPTLGGLSRARYRSYFAMLGELAERPLDGVTHDDWQGHINALLQTYARGTVDRAKAIWSGVLSAAVRAGHLRANTLLGTRLGRAADRVPRAWRIEEQHRLLAAAAGEPHDVWLHVGLATGLRFAELRDLEIDDVDLVELTVHVREGKGRKDRILPLAEETAALVAAHVKRLDPGATYLLGRTDGSRYAPATLRRWLARLCRAATVRVLPPHSMRHSYASTAIADGVDLAALSHDLGHSDVAITARIYAHYITRADRPTARAVSRRLYGSPSPSAQRSAHKRASDQG